MLKVCGHVKRLSSLSSWREPFFFYDYNNMAMRFLTKLNFWRMKLYKIRLDSFLYFILIHGNEKHDRLPVQIVLNGLRYLERYQYELHRVLPTRLTAPQGSSRMLNAMFFNCLCSSVFLENSRVYFPFLSTDSLQ